MDGGRLLLLAKRIESLKERYTNHERHLARAHATVVVITDRLLGMSIAKESLSSFHIEHPIGREQVAGEVGSYRGFGERIFDIVYDIPDAALEGVGSDHDHCFRELQAVIVKAEDFMSSDKEQDELASKTRRMFGALFLHLLPIYGAEEATSIVEGLKKAMSQPNESQIFKHLSPEIKLVKNDEHNEYNEYNFNTKSGSINSVFGKNGFILQIKQQDMNNAYDPERLKKGLDGLSQLTLKPNTERTPKVNDIVKELEKLSHEILNSLKGDQDEASATHLPGLLKRIWDIGHDVIDDLMDPLRNIAYGVGSGACYDILKELL